MTGVQPIPMRRFRFQRGSLADSMLTMVTVSSRRELYRHIAVTSPLSATGVADALSARRYVAAPDRRIGWDETYLVMIGADPIGFIDGPLEELPEGE